MAHPTQGARTARWRRKPRGAYSRHRENAKRRGVPFLLTYRQWLAIWCLSGKWSQRGNRQHEYVMCRRGDRGAYAVGNVYIAQNSHNLELSLWTRPARARGVHRRHTANSTAVTFSEDPTVCSCSLDNRTDPGPTSSIDPLDTRSACTPPAGM
jgi:hypothetical protein